MKALLRISALGLLCLLGCRHAPPKPTAPVEEEAPLRARDFYPLKVGNQWTYAFRAGGQDRERTVSIVSEENGFFADTMGARLRQDNTGLRDEHRYLLENPIEPGHAWVSVQSIKSTEHFMITEAGHPCTVKAGTFGACAVVRMTETVKPGQTLVLESTYAQGIGLVALRSSIESANGSPVPQLELELVAYQMAP